MNEMTLQFETEVKFSVICLQQTILDMWPN